eukprot:UN13140
MASSIIFQPLYSHEMNLDLLYHTKIYPRGVLIDLAHMRVLYQKNVTAIPSFFRIS